MAEAELRSMETDVPLDVVYNPFFQQVNALMSLWLALQRRPSEFLVLNGDTLFTAAAIRNLLRAPRNQGICVQFSRLVERHETQRVRGVIPHRSTDDAVKIMVDRGLLTHIGKDIPEERATGESAGAMRFLGDGAAAAIRQIEEMARQPVNHSAYWYALVSRLIAEGLPVHVRACPRDQWTEIDDRGDLELVKATMYRWQAPRGARPDRCRRSA
jgi:choline kinase